MLYLSMKVAAKANLMVANKHTPNAWAANCPIMFPNLAAQSLLFWNDCSAHKSTLPKYKVISEQALPN